MHFHSDSPVENLRDAIDLMIEGKILRVTSGRWNSPGFVRIHNGRLEIKLSPDEQWEGADETLSLLTAYSTTNIVAVAELVPAPATLAESLTAYPASEGHLHKRAGWHMQLMIGRSDLEAADWLVSTDGGETWFSVNGNIMEEK